MRLIRKVLVITELCLLSEVLCDMHDDTVSFQGGNPVQNLEFMGLRVVHESVDGEHNAAMVDERHARGQ